MATAEQCRAKSTEYAELLKKTAVASEIRHFQRSTSRFDLLAQNEEWLAANVDKTDGLAPKLADRSMPAEDAATAAR